MEENNSYIEKYIKDFILSKTRIFAFVAALISVICSLLFITENSLNAITLIYAISIIFTGISAIIHISDIYSKNKHHNDFLMCGFALNLIGIILRTLQLAILFSVRYFIAYCVFAYTIILYALKFSKNKANTKAITLLSILSVLYCIFEFFYSNTMYTNIFTAKIYRISEATLFLTYLGILKMNKNNFQNFSDNVGNYKKQIPSLKICFGIFSLIAVIAICIGGVRTIGNSHPNISIVQKNESSEKKTGTKKNETVSKNESATSQQSKPSPIALGETVSNDNFEFTLNKVELSYVVKPDNPPSYYRYYTASDGQVYIYVNASVKNLKQQNVDCDEVYSVTANYNNGYTYNGFNIVTDSDGDFTYANINSISPLQTMGIHCLIDCPQEVETSANPLTLTIKLKGGNEYLYTIR